jgi:hypothetical protein
MGSTPRWTWDEVLKHPKERTYSRVASAVFSKTSGPFGGLSNMAGGYRLLVNDVWIPSSEALYQACRFPDQPDIQKLIISQPSPMTAKMKGKPYRHALVSPSEASATLEAISRSSLVNR